MFAPIAVGFNRWRLRALWSGLVVTASAYIFHVILRRICIGSGAPVRAQRQRTLGLLRFLLAVNIDS